LAGWGRICSLDLALTIGEVLEEACAFTQGLLREHGRVAEALSDPELSDSEHDKLQEAFETLHHSLEGILKRFPISESATIGMRNGLRANGPR
jgi:hypothetical protein